MRTYLTRLTLSAAGVVLTGIGTAAAAHAAEEDLTILDESPLYVEDIQTLQPVDKCEIDFTIEECGLPVYEEPKPVFTFNPGVIDPGVVGGGDDGEGSGADPTDEPGADPTDEPGADPTDEPGGGATEDPEGGEPDPSEGGKPEEPAEEPGDTGSEPESDDGAAGGEPGTSGDAGDGSGGTSSSSDSASQNTTDVPTPESDESTITPSVQSASSDGGSSDLLFAVLVSALAAFGLGIIGFGLGRSPRPVRNPRR